MKEHYLLDTETVKTYLVEELRLFSPNEPLDAEEIGDGNINYVFRVRSRTSGKSIIVKQADRLLRSSGRPLDITRSRREADALRIYAALTPQFVPRIYAYDDTMSAICMEDISYCGNLRKELMAGRPLPASFAENAASFLADAVFPTSDLFLPPEEKKERVKAFINPELCAISETLVFSEPYCNGKKRNRITPGNEAFVQKTLYNDEVLKAEVASLREIFMNKAEALIHGDLHTGSIFIGNTIDVPINTNTTPDRNATSEPCMKIIDPEFAFYGPIGYDLGNIIANLYCAWMYAAFTRKKLSAADNFIERMAAAIEALPQLFTAKALKRCNTVPLSDPLYNERYIRRRIAEILVDAYGFAGTEIIRRTIGDTKTAEFDAMGSDPRRVTMERIIIKIGCRLIKRRRQANIGALTITYFKKALLKSRV
ncbi:S-methyl-5-thioribose kinase [Treponema medium]|uniref:5-methylthioribose kinase n=2 Tax=Treponema medium TaxID=58231 RepID=A0AA87NW09_TREMD|nr:phosphotransferase [Treponema medium]EPF29884.1 5-methylthioribose kinase [Treponema medium ATCC 700293]QSH96747.1 S-methyl-5-thioribose kinase [Treponema medium]